jgi:hypothetical protein
VVAQENIIVLHYKIRHMKQITIEVQDNKYGFLLELLKNFNFIKIKSEKKPLSEKEALLQNIARGVQEAILAGQGKIKTRLAKDFLNEL